MKSRLLKKAGWALDDLEDILQNFDRERFKEFVTNSVKTDALRILPELDPHLKRLYAKLIDLDAEYYVDLALEHYNTFAGPYTINLGIPLSDKYLSLMPTLSLCSVWFNSQNDSVKQRIKEIVRKRGPIAELIDEDGPLPLLIDIAVEHIKEKEKKKTSSYTINQVRELVMRAIHNFDIKSILHLVIDRSVLGDKFMASLEPYEKKLYAKLINNNADKLAELYNKTPCSAISPELLYVGIPLSEEYISKIDPEQLLRIGNYIQEPYKSMVRNILKNKLSFEDLTNYANRGFTVAIDALEEILTERRS